MTTETVKPRTYTEIAEEVLAAIRESFFAGVSDDDFDSEREARSFLFEVLSELSHDVIGAPDYIARKAAKQDT